MNVGDAEIETGIARIWRDLLRHDGEIDREADFFALGGDSLLALRMSFLIEDRFGVPVRIERLSGRLSISALAHILRGDFGRSVVWNVPVSEVLWPRLGATALLGGIVFAIMVPLITVIALSYATLLEGSVLTETVFAWPGLGLYITTALFSADMPAVLGGTVVVGMVFVGLNMFSDILYRIVDPRAR